MNRHGFGQTDPQQGLEDPQRQTDPQPVADLLQPRPQMQQAGMRLVESTEGHIDSSENNESHWPSDAVLFKLQLLEKLVSHHVLGLLVDLLLHHFHCTQIAA